VAAVLREADAALFAPPAEGRLSRRQLEMYLAVGRRALAIRGVTSESQEQAAAPLRAAEWLGYNPKEYLWVASAVGEARLTAAAQEVERKVAESRERMRGYLEGELARTTDVAKRREVAERIAELGSGPPQGGASVRRANGIPDAVRFNAALLLEYAAPLAELRRAEARLGARGLGPAAASDRRR
jgi:hypothetical protein